MVPQTIHNKVQTLYRDLTRFTWFVYFSDTSLSILPPIFQLLCWQFCFWTHRELFSFSECLNLFFSSVWNALPSNSSPFQHWGSNSYITSLVHLSPTILTKEASILILYYDILCRRLNDSTVDTYYHSPSTGRVYFIFPVLFGFAELNVMKFYELWIVMTNSASWL